MKKIRGEDRKHIKITFIETFCGEYSNKNVLEGFYANNEYLCDGIEEDKVYFCQDFFIKCVNNIKIILKITETE